MGWDGMEWAGNSKNYFDGGVHTLSYQRSSSYPIPSQLMSLATTKLSLAHPSPFHPIPAQRGCEWTITVATSRIAAEHGSFNRIRRVASMYPQSNTWFFGPTRICLPRRRLNNFCRAHPCNQHTQPDRQTDIQTHEPHNTSKICISWNRKYTKLIFARRCFDAVPFLVSNKMYNLQDDVR